MLDTRRKLALFVLVPVGIVWLITVVVGLAKLLEVL